MRRRPQNAWRIHSVAIILQVHDELIFESPNAELKGAAKKIKQAMETAAGLSVPLKVQVSTGKNWGELS